MVGIQNLKLRKGGKNSVSESVIADVQILQYIKVEL